VFWPFIYTRTAFLGPENPNFANKVLVFEKYVYVVARYKILKMQNIQI